MNPTRSLKPAEPPNGGWLAWRQVVASLFMSMCSLGLANSFGIFQSYYQDNLLQSYTPSAIAWIGTTQGFLVNIVGVISGLLYDLGHVRPLIYAGMLLNLLGLVLTSFATTYVGVFLSLGVCVGLGSGSIYVPSLAIIASYFTSRRPLATGISVTGASIGGVIYPVLFRLLIDSVGFPWACRAFALLNGGLLLVSCLMITPRVVPSASPRRMFDPSAIRDVLFLLFSVALFFLWLGIDVPFFFLPSFAEQHLALPAQTGGYLLAAMSASSIFGRVLLGLFAVYIGVLGVWQASIGASCVLLASWIVINNLPGIIVFVILYGFFTGGVVSLVSSTLLVISPDLSVVGNRLGMSSIFAGFGFLVGPPIAGAIQKTTAGFIGQAAFAGSANLTAFGVIGLVIWLHRRRRTSYEAESARTSACDLTEMGEKSAYGIAEMEGSSAYDLTDEILLVSVAKVAPSTVV